MVQDWTSLRAGTVYRTAENVQTDDYIVIECRNYTMFLLYDSRTTIYEMPFDVARRRAESVNVTGNLTIIEAW